MNALPCYRGGTASPPASLDYAGEWWRERFSPEAYRPVPQRDANRFIWASTIDPIEIIGTDPNPDLEHLDVHVQDCSSTTRTVRGLAVGLHKTELDENETKSFRQFVKRADRRKTVRRRRVRMLQSDESNS